jgi:hypothetical protein
MIELFLHLIPAIALSIVLALLEILRGEILALKAENGLRWGSKTLEVLGKIFAFCSCCFVLAWIGATSSLFFVDANFKGVLVAAFWGVSAVGLAYLEKLAKNWGRSLNP